MASHSKMTGATGAHQKPNAPGHRAAPGTSSNSRGIAANQTQGA